MTPAYARLCLPFLAALMLTDGRIDPRRFTPEGIADPTLAALAAKVSLIADGNEDPNALFPQDLRVRLTSGETQTHSIAATLGSGQPMARRAISSTHASTRMLAASCPGPDSDPYWSLKAASLSAIQMHTQMPTSPRQHPISVSSRPLPVTSRIQGTASAICSGRDTRFGTSPEKINHR